MERQLHTLLQVDLKLETVLIKLKRFQLRQVVTIWTIRDSQNRQQSLELSNLKCTIFNRKSQVSILFRKTVKITVFKVNSRKQKLSLLLLQSNSQETNLHLNIRILSSIKSHMYHCQQECLPLLAQSNNYSNRQLRS